jgi:organic radical activating enzyme
MITIPWEKQTVPHGVLEITRQCNLECRACYREKKSEHRTLEQIKSDLKILEQHLAVQTVSLAGGDPTMHPDLCAIVRMVHERGHKVLLATNGILLTNDLLQQLKSAGLDIIALHIDEGQPRPDLPAEPTGQEINHLRKTVARRVAAHGMQPALSITLYPEQKDNWKSLIECLLSTPDINFLLAIHAADFKQLRSVSDDAKRAPLKQPFSPAASTNQDVAEMMQQSFGLHAFAAMNPANEQTSNPHCITYYIPVLHTSTGYETYKINSGPMDRKLIDFSRKLKGRYLYYCPPHGIIIWIQMLCNGWANRTLFNALRFLIRSCAPQTKLRAKRLIFENTPVVMPDGQIQCSPVCINQTVRNETVVPICLADIMEDQSAC